ncbi:MAG: glycosyltransferase family 39 protein [Phycisphaerae bacterium]
MAKRRKKNRPNREGTREPAEFVSAGPARFGAGLIVAAICAIVFFWAGVGRFGVRVSGWSHHNLTANAWLHGRLYATADEIEHNYFTQWFIDRGQRMPRSTTTDQLRQSYRRIWQASLSRKGFNNAQIEARIKGMIGNAYHDWVRIKDPGGDRFYAYWPPVPAVMMLPLVIAAGPTASDVLVGNALGSLIVLFTYLMLRELSKHWRALSTRACALLTILFGLGTCHFYQATIGQVWYLTQLTGTLFLIIAMWFAFKALAHPKWIVPAGVALGLGFLSRSTIILAAPFFAVVLWIAVRDSADRLKRYIGWGVAFNAMLLLAIGVQFGFNDARFGHPLEFGQGKLTEEDSGGNPIFTKEFKKYGRFNFHYLPRNVQHYFLHVPWPWDFELGNFKYKARRHPKQPGWTYDPWGDGLFFVSPAMLFIFLCWRQKRRDLLVATLAGLIPGTAALMLFHGTGYYQFGQRYLLDTMPFFLLLAAFGMRGRMSKLAVTLIALSVLVNSWGTYRFGLEQPP